MRKLRLQGLSSLFKVTEPPREGVGIVISTQILCFHLLNITTFLSGYCSGSFIQNNRKLNKIKKQSHSLWGFLPELRQLKTRFKRRFVLSLRSVLSGHQSVSCELVSCISSYINSLEIQCLGSGCLIILAFLWSGTPPPTVLTPLYSMYVVNTNAITFPRKDSLECSVEQVTLNASVKFKMNAQV